MQWNWKKSGLALGLTFVLAIVLVKPIGVSTQFVIVDGIIASLFNDSLVYPSSESPSGYGSDNAYLNKSGGKYAAAIANPLNYGLMFVASMIVGGFIASRQLRRQDADPPRLPLVHRQRFGNDTLKRYLLSFVGGFLCVYGARMAGGCTSGHMMSGMMQTSVSGFVFAASAFAAAVPTAIWLYDRGAKKS
ncbi:MAG: YeeE/YedE thiosulfate transporter family protein [Candidatus Pelagadaptatus aseana]